MSAIIEKLKEVTKDMLSEENLNQLSEAFEQQVDKIAEERAKLQLESLAVKIDEDHAEKVQQLVEAIDRNHAGKLMKVVDAINENHTQKLRAVVQKYEKSLNEDASSFKNTLVESISNYLEVYLEENLPQSMVEEAVNNKRANTVLSELRNMLSVDLVLGQENIKSAVLDGKKQIEESANQLKTLQKKNRDLAIQFEKAKSELVLEKKISGLSKEKQGYMKRIFNNKTSEFITENFDYSSKLFDKQELKKLEELTEQAKNESVTAKVDRPVINEQADHLVEESNEIDHPPMSAYMSELGRV